MTATRIVAVKVLPLASEPAKVNVTVPVPPTAGVAVVHEVTPEGSEPQVAVANVTLAGSGGLNLKLFSAALVVLVNDSANSSVSPGEAMFVVTPVESRCGCRRRAPHGCAHHAAPRWHALATRSSGAWWFAYRHPARSPGQLSSLSPGNTTPFPQPNNCAVYAPFYSAANN
jgi:hypothetical protein